MVRRAEIAQARCAARLAIRSCSAAVSRDLPMPGSPESSTTWPSPVLGPRPAPQQQLDLLLAADQRGQRRSRATLRIGSRRRSAQHLPSRHRLGEALHLDGAEIAVLEEIADQPPRARGDDDRVRLGQGLQPGGEVRGFADDRLLLRRALADQIADDHQPGRNPDARLELGGFDIEANDASMTPSPARTARSASSSCACG